MGAAIEPGTIDHIGNFPIDDQRKHSRPVVRVVFKVGILDDDDISRGTREPGPQSGTFTAIPLVKKDSEREAPLVLRTIRGKVQLAAVIERYGAPNAIRMCQIPPQPLRGSVLRAIVHDDDLFWYLGDCPRDLLQDGPDGLCFVVGGDDDGQQRGDVRMSGIVFHRWLMVPQLRWLLA